jgi:hypothetical protein
MAADNGMRILDQSPAGWATPASLYMTTFQSTSGYPSKEETGKGADGKNGNYNADRGSPLIGCERRHGF